MYFWNKLFGEPAAAASPIPDHYQRTFPPSGYLRMITDNNYSRNAQGIQPTLNMVQDIAQNIDIRIAKPEPLGCDTWNENNVCYGHASDCEDFALHVRKQLIEKGCADHFMHMATTYAKHEYHAVLLINTTSGWYVYDNLKDGRIVSASRYKFEKIEKSYNYWIASS